MSKNFIIKSFVGLLFLVSCLNANPPRNSTPSPPPPIQVSLPSNYNDDSTYNDDALTETALFTPSSFKQTSTSDFLAAYMDPEKSLPIINLSQYQYLTDDDLINIAKVHTLSEYLDISGCYQITDAGIEGLSQYCQALKSINFSNCPNITDRGILYIARNCPLEKINLSGNNINTTGLEALLQRSNSIKYLNFSECNLLREELRIALGNLLHACNNLESLNLENCRIPMAEQILLNLKEKTQKNLKELKINGCFFINRESFANFIARCKSLENLNVDTAQLNYIVIDSIGKNLKKLRIFSIYPLTAYDYHSNPSVVRLSANTITTEQIAFLKNKNRKLTIKIGEQIY